MLDPLHWASRDPVSVAADLADCVSKLHSHLLETLCARLESLELGGVSGLLQKVLALEQSSSFLQAGADQDAIVSTIDRTLDTTRHAAHCQMLRDTALARPFSACGNEVLFRAGQVSY